MSKSIPTLQKYMTVLPHTIGKDQTLAHAEDLMHEYRVRHLPVLDAGQLVGILTDRDIKLVETFKDVEADKVKVEEAYSPDPYITSPSALLSEVCDQMVAKKYGCVLVVDNKKLVGIFTWVDALKAFSELLDSRLKH
jgi:acetoin utilization protein AcuB